MRGLGTSKSKCKAATVAHAPEMDTTSASRSKRPAEYFCVTIADGLAYVGARENAEVEVAPAGPAIVRISVDTEERQRPRAIWGWVS